MSSVPCHRSFLFLAPMSHPGFKLFTRASRLSTSGFLSTGLCNDCPADDKKLAGIDRRTLLKVTGLGPLWGVCGRQELSTNQYSTFDDQDEEEPCVRLFLYVAVD